MSKYTQGPWLMHKANGERLIISKAQYGVPIYLAKVFGVAPSQGDADKNMALLAEAPQLLEHLQKAVASLEWAAAVIGDIPPNSEYMESLREARALIAKVAS